MSMNERRFVNQCTVLDEEWIQLMLIARAWGITKEMIQKFLLEKQFIEKGDD